MSGSKKNRSRSVKEPKQGKVNQPTKDSEKSSVTTPSSSGGSGISRREWDRAASAIGKSLPSDWSGATVIDGEWSGKVT